MSEKRVLVTGATGLLGRAVYTMFKANGWNALGTGLSRVTGDLVSLDLCNFKEVSETVETFKPSAIVHCAAQRFPDKVEKDLEATKILNCEATKHLASIAAQRNIAFLYISTDYVFDGKNPPYGEDSTPNPLNAYGKTKLLGEQATLAASSDHIVLRIPILYGPVQYLNESAVTCLYGLLKQTEPISVSDYEIRYPSHVDDIATICLHLIELKNSSSKIGGIYHWGGKEAMTKYSMLKTMADVFQRSMSHISPEQGPGTGGASRPYNAQLANTKIEQLGIGRHTPFRQGIEQCLISWVEQE